MKIIPSIIVPTTQIGVHIREAVTATLSLGVVGAAIYEILKGNGNNELSAWAGMIVGVYFGGGRAVYSSPSKPPDKETTLERIS